jgi:tape measure domain-containing protein
VSVVANVAINVDSTNAVSKLRQVQTQATATERAFGGVTAAVGKLVAAFAAVQAVKFVFVQAAELQSQARSLEVLTGSAQKAGQIIKELQQLGAVTPFTSTELIDSAKRLQAFGVEADKVVETTRRLADVSGATGAELSGLVTAYGQVQAKGRLQGEELLQFQERGVALQTELRKMYGLSGDEFQKALEKGRIGAEAVQVAIINLTNAGGKYANGAIAQSDTLNGKLSTLQDSFQQLARNIGTFFEPVFKFLIDGINAFLDRVNNGLRASAQLKANEQAATRTRSKFGLVRQINPFDQEAQQYEERLQKSIFKSLTSQGGAGGAPSAPASTAVPALLGATGGGGRAAGGASKAASDAKRAADEALRESQRVADVVRDQQFITKQKGIQTKFAQLIFEAEQSADPIRVRQLQTVEALVLAGNETARLLEEEKNSVAQLAIARTRQGEAEAIRQEGAQDVLKLQLEQKKNFDEIIADLNFELKLKQATTEEAREQLRLENELRKLKGQGFTDEQVGQITGLQTQIAAPDTAAQTIEKRIGTLKDEITGLTSISSIAITVADGIGVAFGQAFQGLITGSMNAKEALGTFFKSVGDMFVQMATEIIAKQITMIILQTLLKALGGGFGGGGGGGLSSAFGSSGPTFNPGAFSMPALAANGATFANGIAKFANGGIVSSPTMFKFADGGAMRTGLMGEAGPEAIMPLKRGPDGSLGVQANGLRDAMDRDRSGTNNGAPVLNMSFQSTNIAGVEYVSRDQLEQAMFETRRQASRDGAKRGMSMTLDKLQQSPSTRRRVGI